MENGDEYPKHRINHANAAGSEPALKYVQANGVRFAYLEQGDGPLVMFLHGFPDNAWSYRKQLQVVRGCGLSCGRAVPARLCADRDSGGRHFRSDRTGQGSRSAHRGAERRRTSMRRRHGLGRHVDLSGAGHGAIGDQGRRGHEHRAPDHNLEHQKGSRCRSIRLPCLFLSSCLAPNRRSISKDSRSSTISGSCGRRHSE